MLRFNIYCIGTDGTFTSMLGILAFVTVKQTQRRTQVKVSDVTRHGIMGSCGNEKGLQAHRRKIMKTVEVSFI